MDHHLLKPVITWQWLHALGWNLALTFCKLYKCEFFFVANEQKKLSLIIILGEELKATEEVILITRLFQMIKVWMPNCISHLHHHIYDHIFACLQWRKLQVVEKIPCEKIEIVFKWFTRTSVIFHWDMLLIKKLSPYFSHRTRKSLELLQILYHS